MKGLDCVTDVIHKQTNVFFFQKVINFAFSRVIPVY